MTDEKLYLSDQFKLMPLDMLMTKKSIDGNDEHNDALWKEQEERLNSLNIAALDNFKSVENYQDKMDARLKKVEAAFEALVKLIGESGIVDVPRRSLRQYLEDKIK